MASGVQLRMLLPFDMNDGVTFGTYFRDTVFNPDPDPTYPDTYIPGKFITYNVGALAPGDSRTFRFNARSTPSAADSRQFKVAVQAESNNGIGSATAQGTAAFGSTTLAPPVVTPIASQTIVENTSTGALGFVISDADTPVNNLTLSKSSNDQALIPDVNIVITGTGANRSVTVTPAPNAAGTAIVTVEVSDGYSQSHAWFRVTVNDLNDAPVISDIPDQTIPYGGTLAGVNFTVGDAETAAALLTLSATSSNPALVPVAAVTFGGNGANRTVSAQPVQGQSGTATITVIVSDGLATAQDSFLLTVNALTGISAWRQANFGALADLPSVAGDTADPDLDGVVNLLEYCAGTSPLLPSSTARPTVAVNAGRMNFTFQRNNAAQDLTITVEVADTIAGPWTALARSINGAPATALLVGVNVSESGIGSVRQVNVSDNVTIGAAGKKTRYLRLRAAH